MSEEILPGRRFQRGAQKTKSPGTAKECDVELDKRNSKKSIFDKRI
jgi:hypothetical protein